MQLLIEDCSQAAGLNANRWPEWANDRPLSGQSAVFAKQSKVPFTQPPRRLTALLSAAWAEPSARQADGASLISEETHGKGVDEQHGIYKF